MSLNKNEIQMTKNEKIEILTEVLNIYKNKESKSVHGMCLNLELLIHNYELQSNLKGLDICNYIPEFCRHKDYNKPVLWFPRFDHESRINYLLETIKIIENN